VIPKPPPRAREKAAKTAATERQRRETYRLVELRDGMKCRACARRVVKTTILSLARLEHHHVRGRGRKDSESTANLVCLCKGCHDDRHVTRSLSVTGNADSTLTFEQDGRVWHG